MAVQFETEHLDRFDKCRRILSLRRSPHILGNFSGRGIQNLGCLNHACQSVEFRRICIAQKITPCMLHTCERLVHGLVQFHIE